MNRAFYNLTCNVLHNTIDYVFKNQNIEKKNYLTTVVCTYLFSFFF